MFEEEPVSLKDKIIRGIVGIFLFVLVAMLAVTFLPGDVEQNFLGLLSGESSTVAGKVGSINLPMDSFLAARRDCANRFKEYSPQMAENPETINSCAFYTLKSLVVSREVGDSVGYHVSENKIKSEVYQEAKFYYDQIANQPGYTADDVRPLSSIYRDLLVQAPIRYRQEMAIARGIYESFLQSNLPSPPNQKKIQATDTKFTLKVLSFNEIDILNRLENEVSVTDTEIADEYKKETDADTIPKNKDGIASTLTERTPILRNKIKLEKKRAKLEEIKSQLPTLKDNPQNAGEISRLVGKPWVQSTGSIADFSQWKLGNETVPLTTDPAFLKDVAKVPFGTGKLSGAYKDGDRTYFVEFVSFTKTTNPVVDSTQSEPDGNLYGFYMESFQSISENYPLQRSKVYEVE